MKALPGFGDQKARIFVALLGKQLGVRPPGWETAAGPYGEPGAFRSVADIDSPDALAKVRQYKQAMKAEARAEARPSRGERHPWRRRTAGACRPDGSTCARRTGPISRPSWPLHRRRRRRCPVAGEAPRRRRAGRRADAGPAGLRRPPGAVHLNDRPDLAAAMGADGVHVGQDDMLPPRPVRLVGPDAIVGLSTHGPRSWPWPSATPWLRPAPSTTSRPAR